MTDIAIRVDGLAKQYQIATGQNNGAGHSYKSLRDAVAHIAAWPSRNAARLLSGQSKPAKSSETFWALQDVSFEVKRGEVIGVIGNNGAGKSTLLKILSRITQPTRGRVEIHGRLRSLLEVGTGFHPELSGRENVYLNGAILGMRRKEINGQFDEIVAFSGVEQFIDTAVKYYSSGMYLRLAFAVAAHLQPETLVIDEVLAVGDSEFQKKCLGKIGTISKEGRTVIFVSHNLAAIRSLTTRALVLSHGRLVFAGSTESAIHSYVQMARNSASPGTHTQWGHGRHTAISAVRLIEQDGQRTDQYIPGTPLSVEVEIETDGRAGLSLEIFLVDASGSRLAMASTYQFHGLFLPAARGRYLCRVELQSTWLASGRYSLDVASSVVNVTFDHFVEAATDFNVPFSNPLGHELDFKQSYGFGSIALLASSPIHFEPITT